MATGMNHGFHTLQNNKPAIIYRVAKQANPEWFSLKLQEEGMILTENASAIVNNLAWSDEVKVNRLIQAVESKLKHGINPAQIFQKFVKILQSEPALEDLAQKLQTEYQRIPMSEEDELENGDTEEIQLINLEEGERHEQTQNKQEFRSDQPCEIRCTRPGGSNPCFVITCCYGGLFSLILSAVAYIELSLKSEKSDLKVRRDTEKEITRSTVSYNYNGILFMERELLLWLSCFVIFTPWILVQYIPSDKWKKIKRLLPAVYSLLVLVGTLYFLKDFECFKIWGFFSAAILSLMNTPIIFIHIPLMCCFCKKFCLRLFLALLTLTVVVIVVAGLLFYGTTSLPDAPPRRDDSKSVIVRALWLVLDILVPQIIFVISANISAVYDHGHALNRDLALPLSILGVVTSVLLPSALLLVLKVSLKHRLLYAALLLLVTNLVLLTATILITRLPPSFPACFGDRKWFKAIVVYYVIFIGVRNLLLEVLVVWRTFYI